MTHGYKLAAAAAIVILFICLCVTPCQSNTLKPFVRSRYSQRWRLTTETPKLMDTTTPSYGKHEAVNTFRTQEASNTLTKDLVPPMTSDQNLLKTSTHAPDYDYYGNNELEENEHRI